MMKFIVTAAMLAASCVCAQESDDAEKPHRVYLGPDIAFWHATASIKARNEVHQDYIDFFPSYHFKDQGFLYGGRIGYDFVKLRSVYFGASASCITGRIENTAKVRAAWIHRDWRDHSRLTMFNPEGRVGYTFEGRAEKSWVAPFVGAGAYLFHNTYDGVSASNWGLYVSAGCRTARRFNSVFELGANLKVTYLCAIMQNVASHVWVSPEMTGSERWGGEVGWPLTFYFGEESSWDLQLEPYFIKTSFEGSSIFIGARLVSGYRF